MPKFTAVEIPFVNLNDENVKLISWLVTEGEEVREGQNIAEVETSKALVELLSPDAGQIHLKVLAGEELPVGSIVAYIGEYTPDSKDESHDFVSAGGPAGRGLDAPNATGARFSKKALELIQSKQISLGSFAGASLIRERDVLAYLAAASAETSNADQVHFALKGIPTTGLTFPAIFSKTDSGRIDATFLELLRAIPESVENLESAEKCKLYRAHGADIGESVSIGKGTVIVAPQIQIGNQVQLGRNSSIALRERFAAGTFSSFRDNLMIRGGTAIFGENTFAGSRVQIGGGGHSDPWALLVAGDNVYLGDDLFINICRPVLIGKEVFLTQRAILVTHNIGHSILEGNENAFAPIVLEDYSQVGMNSTIYAGARVGQSAILASNSYLISSIPKGKLAMGVPAQVVRDAARPVDRAKQLHIAETMFRQFHELLSLKGVQVTPIRYNPFLTFDASHGGKKYQMGFAETLQEAEQFSWVGNENVFWTFGSTSALSRQNVTEMNLLAKTFKGSSGMFVDSAREFLRKRGIRLEPGPWRYQKSLI